MNHREKVDIDTFNERAHGAVDSVGLCGSEIEFLHSLINIIESDNYIEDYLKVYEHTDQIDRYQIGDVLLQYLKSSQHLSITK